MHSMTIVKIFKIEDADQVDPVSILEEGVHVIGRGNNLNCSDKRVSRNHALIDVGKEEITIKSVHINPCFFKAANGKNIEILKKDQSVALNDGDHFALLADNYWYRVKILTSTQHVQDPSEVGLNNNSVPLSNPSKRCNIDDDSSEDCKRTKLSNPNELVNIHLSETSPLSESSHNEIPNEDKSSSQPFDLADLLSSSANVNVTHSETKVLLDNLENIISEDNVAHKEIISDSEESEDLLENFVKTEIKTDESTPVKVVIKTAEENKEIKEEHGKTEIKLEDNMNSTNVDTPSVSTDTGNQQQSVTRDRCWYGASCYRENKTHRADFSHPGDPDYDNPSDNRPNCPYGTACYRTNLDHRKQYKHLAKPAPKPSNQGSVILNTNPNSPARSTSPESEADASEQETKTPKVKKNYNESPIDSYDYDDPFIDDASSDEFQISTDGDEDDDSTTDWEDSEQVPEDRQETKRLLREAKRFTKKKHKKNQ